MDNKDFNKGDIVYPAYDAKASRITKCEVVQATEDTIHVRGIFWGMDSNEEPIVAIFKRDSETPEEWSGWVKYNDDEPTMMEYLGVTDEDEEGDFYMLYTRQRIDDWIAEGLLKKKYLPEL